MTTPITVSPLYWCCHLATADASDSDSLVAAADLVRYKFNVCII